MQDVDHGWNSVVEVDERDHVVQNDHIVPQKAEDLLNGAPSVHETPHSLQHVQPGNRSHGVGLEFVLNHKLDCGETVRDQVKEAAAEEFRQRNDKRHIEFQFIDLPVHWNERLQPENADNTITVVAALELKEESKQTVTRRE